LSSSTDLMAAVAQVCDPYLFIDIDPKNKTNCDHCAEILEYMIGDMTGMLVYCQHLSNDTCENMFEPVVTESGVCYTSNSLKVFRENNQEIEHTVDNWTLDDGYKWSFKSRANVHPRPGTTAMFILDLAVYNVMNDGMCKGPIKGFHVYVHLPNEAPQISKHYYLVPYQQTVQISVNPTMIKTAHELRDISLDKRQCYFNDERYLRFYRHYTQNNCEVECVANMTVSKCACQRFYMPSNCKNLKGNCEFVLFLQFQKYPESSIVESAT
jgi:acid-sensing ion channel, other